MAIWKVVGQNISGQVSFQYRGPGGTYWYGFGLAPEPRTNVLQWYTRSTNLPNATNWQTFTDTITGVIPWEFQTGVNYDAYVVVYRPDGTQELGVWNDGVYYVEPVW